MNYEHRIAVEYLVKTGSPEPRDDVIMASELSPIQSKIILDFTQIPLPVNWPARVEK